MDKKDNQLWCPNCNTIIDITKNKLQLKKNIDAESSENNIENYVEIIEKALKNKKIETEDVSDIKIDILTKTKKFKSLPKEDKEKVLDNVSSLIKEYDNATAAYFSCSNCRWTKEIKKGTKIITKGNTNTSYSTTINLDKYKNMIYAPYLGITREYICINDKCSSHKEHSKREAVYFRDTINSTRTIMVCKECQSPWIAD